LNIYLSCTITAQRDCSERKRRNAENKKVTPAQAGAHPPKHNIYLNGFPHARERLFFVQKI